MPTEKDNKAECPDCKVQQMQHGFSACQIIRWGYLALFVTLILAIASLSGYYYYLTH